ncbi:hypothetical protein L873DRAFT_1799021 [Choiromyces venosus 120613-1]|uniref:Tc1-like transposase DDE domain-containing protein n=1 Tax=Choiromyces venosus 120613-1 TaxID=1336337 RepID=A0A3N4K874_9PEZI|nr:hypothetical protein L873DRAFT_1799021 [Choiromyces venosus 120613-1]
MNIPHLYLIEDNAPSHQTARSVDKEERKEKDYEKDEISTWQFVGASKAVVDGAKAVLVQTWEDLPQAVIDNKCQSFHEKLQRVIIHGGNNNFNG